MLFLVGLNAALILALVIILSLCGLWWVEYWERQNKPLKAFLGPVALIYAAIFTSILIDALEVAP